VSGTTGRTLLVASTGGHLEELVRLRSRLQPQPQEVEWATFDDPQSRSLLSGERVHDVGYIAPRAYGAAARAVGSAARILRRGRFDRVVSTGSGIAIPFLAVARLQGVQGHYIESAARTEAPSMTGKVVSRLPGVRLYTQYRSWADDRWTYAGSLFDGFGSAAAPTAPLLARRVVVTLGTMRTYPFRSAVERLVQVLPAVLAPDAEVLWQVGVTPSSDLGIDGHDLVDATTMRAAVQQADLVIAHAGIGSALTALDAGLCPVLLPRSATRGEHVDEHQGLIARELASRGLAVSCDAPSVTAEHLRAALATRVVTQEQPMPFALDATSVSGSAAGG
jgi:UDP-N-acetylglucosamine--N-acetylmuramyl-(pentapeptide) pyrophosphoryl-undecaprenol N-acetylglucosamine transferase